MDPSNLTQLFHEVDAPAKLQGKQRVELLKGVEALTRDLFKNNAAFQQLRTVLGSENQPKVESAVLDQIWTGIDEYTEEFYRVLEVAVKRQHLQRAFVRLALDSLDHGFDALDRNLIYQSSLVGDVYEDWYRVFCQTVQGTETALQLAKDDKAGNLPQELYNHYTVIVWDASTSSYSQVANAAYYRDEIAAIVAALDRWIAELQRVETSNADVKEKYLLFLSTYRSALAETEVSKLESRWTEVDRTWMEVRHWIQVVHDIESGYGDPLRCKVTPEFSIRLLDEEYQKENATIQEIQDHMVDYFRSRPGKLAQDGISGLKKSMAGIVYLPFQQGVNLFFRFAGQSIPNRSEVRLSHGCKIYFDPVSTKGRQVFAIQVASSVCADPRNSESIDTIETIVYHIAAHEIGHAIYSLDTMKDKIKVSSKTLLEEPRAELTALHTLRLLHKIGYVPQGLVAKVLASFMLQDLRRFVMFDSSATRPYLVSAMSNWARAERLSYLTLDQAGKVVFDNSRVPAFLDECSQQFESILDAEDRGDGPTIEKILQEMQACESAGIVRHLIEELYKKPKAARTAA